MKQKRSVVPGRNPFVAVVKFRAAGPHEKTHKSKRQVEKAQIKKENYGPVVQW